MTNVEEDAPTYSVDTSLLDDLVGEGFVAHILKYADASVTFRLVRAADHYNKAIKLFGLDDEMAVIRLVAAEEELVVAIIQLVKLRADKYPDTGIIPRRFTDHRVKQAFAPTLSRLWSAMEGHFRDGFALEGLEHVRWSYEPVLDEETFKISLRDESGAHIIGIDPLSIMITRPDLEDDEVVEEMLSEFDKWTQRDYALSVGEFIQYRAKFRNQLLYATDEYPIAVLNEPIEAIHEIFKMVFRGLLFVLTALVNNDPPSREWGVVCQFFALYRHVLAKLDVGKAPESRTVMVPDEGFRVVNVKAAGPSE